MFLGESINQISGFYLKRKRQLLTFDVGQNLNGNRHDSSTRPIGQQQERRILLQLLISVLVRFFFNFFFLI